MSHSYGKFQRKLCNIEIYFEKEFINTSSFTHVDYQHNFR